MKNRFKRSDSKLILKFRSKISVKKQKIVHLEENYRIFVPLSCFRPQLCTKAVISKSGDQIGYTKKQGSAVKKQSAVYALREIKSALLTARRIPPKIQNKAQAYLCLRS
jgi:hypothetical protein